MIKMEHGDIKKPTGNAIIFWNIKGNNRILKDAEIIASNFIISPLQINNETLMVNFPPVLLENRDKLNKIVEKENIDLISGGEIYVPDDITDFINFYKKQIEKYNGIIQEYLLAYKSKNKGGTGVQSLPQLINLAGEIMENVRRLVKNKGKQELIEIKIGKLREIQDHLNSEMKGFDLNKIIHYIDKNDIAVDSLVDLYKRKFIAIFLEDYEKADDLNKKIIRIESDLP
jgi:sugar-specific transcriptional regulator TrmB